MRIDGGVGEALGELESQAVDLHYYNIGIARDRNKAAQERLCKAIGMLDKPNMAITNSEAERQA